MFIAPAINQKYSGYASNHRVFTEQPKRLWNATSGDQQLKLKENEMVAFA
jgi:hypothetical protein